MRAVLLDALGTLLALRDPAAALAGLLDGRGLRFGPDEVRRAVDREMAHYRAHNAGAADAASLARLRADCARVMRTELRGVAGVEEVGDDELLGVFAFEVYPDVMPALGMLREAGLRLAVVSNWDVSLHEVLDRTGLRAAVDEVVVSAEVGEAKPGARPFAVALERLGVDASRAVHVGDSVAEDVAGARAAGVRAVLLMRDRERSVAQGVEVVGDLREVVALPRVAGP